MPKSIVDQICYHIDYADRIRAELGDWTTPPEKMIPGPGQHIRKFERRTKKLRYHERKAEELFARKMGFRLPPVRFHDEPMPSIDNRPKS